MLVCWLSKAEKQSSCVNKSKVANPNGREERIN